MYGPMIEISTISPTSATPIRVRHSRMDRRSRFAPRTGVGTASMSANATSLTSLTAGSLVSA